MTIKQKIENLPDDKSLAAGHGNDLTTTQIKELARSHTKLLILLLSYQRNSRFYVMKTQETIDEARKYG